MLLLSRTRVESLRPDYVPETYSDVPRKFPRPRLRSYAEVRDLVLGVTKAA